MIRENVARTGMLELSSRPRDMLFPRVKRYECIYYDALSSRKLSFPPPPTTLASGQRILTELSVNARNNTIILREQ